MTTPKAIIAERVSCQFGTAKIVDAASLTLKPGQVTALLGQSGAGKSTLLRLFSGLEIPKTGRILHGETVWSDGNNLVPAEARNIGIVFQDFALFPNLTAMQNIAFGLTHLPKAEQHRCAAAWLERISLVHRGEAYPHQMSGGEQQRVAIARALAPQPVALLMDEPFSGLDPALRDEVREIALSVIKEAGIPALLVTHDAQEAMLYADHLAIMRAGKILQQGTPSALYDGPVNHEVASALGSVICVTGRLERAGDIIETAFGPFPAPKGSTADTLMVCMRPEAFVPDASSDVHAAITAVQKLGPMVHLTIERQGETARIIAPHDQIAVTATQISYRLNPALCFVF